MGGEGFDGEMGRVLAKLRGMDTYVMGDFAEIWDSGTHILFGGSLLRGSTR